MVEVMKKIKYRPFIYELLKLTKQKDLLSRVVNEFNTDKGKTSTSENIRITVNLLHQQ